jgi:lupus La protein
MRLYFLQYVDYVQGNPSGFVRFDQPEDAQKLRAAAIMAAEGGLPIAKFVVSFEALEGKNPRDHELH